MLADDELNFNLRVQNVRNSIVQHVFFYHYIKRCEQYIINLFQ